ncbi:MAG: hypothetical protein PSY14_05775 [bacterium]|nr:hypothetical protein [bacterium]
MNNKLRKAFFVAVFGVGAGFGTAGAYMAGNAAVDEYITHKAQNDSAKACVQTVKQGGNCTPEQYQWTALYADHKKDYGFGLSWLFGGLSFVRMSLPKIRAPREKPNGSKP